MGQAPPSQLPATVIDDGNATPHLLRSTVYQFPASRAQWHSTGDIPLALQCVPLAFPSQDFVPSLPEETEAANVSVPMLPITNAPPRCSNCLAYANPFATDHKCIFCGVAQTQTLILARPEATVEWEVTGPYITRPSPVQPVQLYVLDLTSPHVEAYKSMLQQLGQDMTDHFQQQASGAAPRIGLCVVSSMGIMIPRWNSSSSEISCLVVADVTEDPFTPAPLEEWTFVMNESADAWCQFLDNLDLKQWRKESFARNAYGLDGSELSCAGAALAFLSNALATSGGRGTLLTWRRPNFGVGSLAYREESQALILGRSRSENTMTYVPVQSQKKPEGNEDETAALFYSKLADECVTNRVTLDIVMHTGSVSANSFLGLASLGELCRVTSGRLYWVQAVQWEESLYNDLRGNIRTFSGWDAVFKVRCSAGVQIKNFVYAPGNSREGALGDSPELELASLSPNTCISVELDHRVGGLPKSSSMVYFQTALLYTSCSGRRLVRVSTLAIPIAKSANDVFQGADFAAILPYLVRTTHAHLVKTINEQKKDDKMIPRQKARDALYATCLNMLVNYRLNTPAISSPTGQLLLPSRLQLLPLFCMCLIKLPLLATGFPCRDPSSAGARIQPSGDERAYFNLQLLQSSPSTCMLLLYPNIYSIDLNSEDNQDLPPLVRPTMESFQDDGIYLIDDGLRIFMYLGRLVPEDTKKMCASRHHEAMEHWLSLVVKGSPNSTGLAIIPVFQQPDHQGLRETGILSLLVEDANVGEKDYVAFLTNMHCDIRNRLQSKK
jgi:protein transport protein SEC24